MSLFKVVPELRRLGVPVQLAAWYPWRMAGSDEPMADSCGIFMCVPCAVAPNLGMNIFADAWWSLDEHEKMEGLARRCPPTCPRQMISNKNSQPAVAENPQKGKDKGKRQGQGQT